MATADAVRLPLDGQAAGRILAEDVRDAHGNLLLPAGSTLSASTVEALARRGVLAVAVRPATPEGAPARTARQVADIEAAIERLFRCAGDGPATQAVKRLIRAHRLEPPRP